MKIGRHGIWKKAAAFLTAILMLTGVFSTSFAVSDDWEALTITLSWADPANPDQVLSVIAIPAGMTPEGEGRFWAYLPQEAPLDQLTFTAEHPDHAYEFIPASGTLLEAVTDAGEVMDGISFLPVIAMESSEMDGPVSELFYLYISTVTDQPREPEELPGEQTGDPWAQLPGETTEEPAEEPTEEPYVEPTEEPYAEPTEEPKSEPTEKPWAEPTEEPMEEPTAELTEEPTEEPTAEPTAEPTEAPPATPAPEIPVGEMINRYGLINKNNVNFRAEPSTKAKKLATLGEGDRRAHV